MIKFISLVALFAAICVAVPIDPVNEATKPQHLSHPADTISGPTPAQKKEDTSTESHVQRIPASGVKLSAEIGTSSATTEPNKKKSERSVDNEGTTAKAAFRRNQPSTTTVRTSSVAPSSTTSSAVSVKTPIVAARSRRDVATSTASTIVPKRVTTFATVSQNEDNEKPHFVRPVPVQQILKNLGQSEHTGDDHKEEPKDVKQSTTTTQRSESVKHPADHSNSDESGDDSE
ncbi:nucleolar protein dao-5-like [Anopheles bellator]|uniref:nucleolar protein dao-5-like n=1 Tax=Anopheles bellator TaxID=139047 RepID=UPI0026485EFB|nr:nucleolar protein dao-5-like [Anopheles bellator]